MIVGFICGIARAPKDMHIGNEQKKSLTKMARLLTVAKIVIRHHFELYFQFIAQIPSK